MKRLHVFLALVTFLSLSVIPLGVLAETQTLKNLHNGNNFLSFYVLPEDATPENVFGDKAGWISQIIGAGEVAFRLNDGSWIGNFKTFSRTGAYWVSFNVPQGATSPFDHDVEGEMSDPDILFNLHPGDNWISYPHGSNSELSASIPGPFSGLFTKISSEGNSANYTEGTGWVGDLTGYTPGYGYNMKASEAIEGFFFNCSDCDGTSDYAYGCTNKYASNYDETADLSDNKCTFPVPESWQPTPGGDQAFYILHRLTINGASLQPDDIVGAFSNGVNVGYGFPDGDITTVPALSLGDGDAVTFVIFDSSTETEYVVAPTETLEFEDSGIEILGCLDEGKENFSELATLGLDNCSDGCVPQSCDAQNAECGVTEDGCGLALDCGECPEGSYCSPDFLCGDVCFPTTCEEQGAVCGDIDDECGGLLSCGGCDEGFSCEDNEACVCTDSSCGNLDAVQEDIVEGDVVAMECDSACELQDCSMCMDNELYNCIFGYWSVVENCSLEGKMCLLAENEEGPSTFQCVDPDTVDAMETVDITSTEEDTEAEEESEDTTPEETPESPEEPEKEKTEPTDETVEEEESEEADSSEEAVDSPEESSADDGCGSCALNGAEKSAPARGGLLLIMVSVLIFIRSRKQWRAEEC